ncbi:O-antigen ligase family protein [Chamaesiphon sp. OTE_20_metabat_361]|uniref:O-antigen ligase family protein n=1 Tax=Chamaesiphon sp. OTE_20_metabat_361 TaxID=2964689 RepID=UPI00286B9DCC|nr:O-antigen ligase family protein [Chamaesiphon sp. OTE_20_metabat_361]
MFLPVDKNSYSSHLYIIFAISMYLIPFSTGTGGGSFVITFAFPFLILLFFFIAGSYIVRKERVNYPNDLKLSLLFAAINLFAIFIASLMNENLIMSFARSVFDLFGFTIFLYIISHASKSQNAALVYSKISQVFVWSGVIMSAYFIVNFLLAVQQNSLDKVLLERENGGLMSLPWGASNTIAGCLMMPFFLALDRAFNTKSLKFNSRAMMFLAMLLIMFAIIVTQSRNVITTLLLGMTFVGILTKNVKSTVLFLVTVITTVTAIAILSGQDLSSIFEARIGDQAQDVGGFNGRTILWDASIIYFALHPFSPLGYFGMLGEMGHTGHNIFLTTLLERGILGLVAYILFLINNLGFSLKKIFDKSLSFAIRRRMTLYLIAMLSILLQLQFEDSNLTAQNIVYQWIFLALMYISPYCDVPETNDGHTNKENQLAYRTGSRSTRGDKIID